MSDFQTGVLDPIAQVIGGTAPDPTNRPRWFSGLQSADGTGIVPGGSYPTFKGCHSAPPEYIEDYPIGVLLRGAFKVGGPARPEVYVECSEENIDELRLWILLNRVDLETTYGDMAPYRDLVPAQMASHMTAFSNVTTAMVSGGKPITVTWGQTEDGTPIEFNAFEFTIRCFRMVVRTYTA